jgi:endonuclease YncB( thermonuclease family)
VAAGLIEAKGNTIALSGVEAVKPDETCSDAAGKSWNCGMRARTAFRAFLRGRAVTCSGARTTKDAAASGTDAPTATVADCKVARQDVGQWLVENGWARAAQGGAYADAGEVARKAGKGIFGAAPDLSGLPPPPAAVEDTAPEAPSSILDLSGTAATPPDDPSMQQQVFPPAPAQ